MLTTDRAVLIRYMRDGKAWRGSGLRVAGQSVLTADHCANGTGHTLVVGGVEYPATVLVRSRNADVDVAVLAAPDLPAVGPLMCAVVDWQVPSEVRGCVALGFPVWKDGAGGPRLAQVPGHIPTAEGLDPRAGLGVVPSMSLKITNPDIRGRRILEGDLDQARSPWAGMSGAVVVTADDRVVGVVRGHSPAEGAGSLTATRLEAIARLPEDVARLFLTTLQMPDPREWPQVPSPDDRVGAAVSAGQVVVGEIPRQPPAFVARETVGWLADAAGRGQVAVVYAVIGLPGMGKTQIAADYARGRVSEGWGLVGWVNAETRDTLLAGLARVAERLGVADPEGDSLESARRLREHLQTRTGVGLLVFDNAADPDGLRPFLPATGGTQVVVTSTDQAFAELGEAVDVSAFSRTESLGYLRARTGLADDADAAAVARELGDLPLGLAQAAATISRQHLTYPRYLQRLAEVPVQTLLGRVQGGDYPRSTAAALLLSIQATEASDPAGLTGWLLRVVAALSPNGVHRDLLEGLRGSGEAAEYEVDAAVERCVAGSLLTWSVTGDAVIMHRLLGRVLRERDQSNGQWTSTVTATLNLLESQLVPAEQAWAWREEGAHLVTQVEALWEVGAGTGDVGLRLRQLRTRWWAVRQLVEAADLSRAIDLGARTLADSERILGADHPDTLTARNNLAATYWRAGRPGEAIPLAERTLADRERILGADHPDTLGSRDILAVAYQSAGRLGQAIPLAERTLADRERILGADHPDTLGSRNNLAAAYQSAGRLGQAIPLAEQMLADRERILGADHPDTLGSRNNLANAYSAAGRPEEAIPLFEQALAELERILGADHPDTLLARNDLAHAHQSAGRLEEAIALFEQTLADGERLLDADHPDIQLFQNNLAAAYRLAGRPEEAIPLFEQTLANRERILSADHPDTLTSRNNLANAYSAAGRPEEAIPLFEQTLADRERILSADHPDTLASRYSLTHAYRLAGRLEQAIPVAEQALAELERVLGADHPHTLTSRNNLAAAYLSAGWLEEAIPVAEQALADSGRIQGADHPDTLTSRDNLAAAYLSAGRPEQAIPLLEQTLASSERILGADHPDTLTSQNNLAAAYLSAGRPEEAIPLLEQTLADRERILGADHPDTLLARNDLAYAYQSAGRLEEAIALLEQMLADRERILGADHPDTLTSRNNLERARSATHSNGSAAPYRASELPLCGPLHQRPPSDRPICGAPAGPWHRPMHRQGYLPYRCQQDPRRHDRVGSAKKVSRPAGLLDAQNWTIGTWRSTGQHRRRSHRVGVRRGFGIAEPMVSITFRYASVSIGFPGPCSHGRGHSRPPTAGVGTVMPPGVRNPAPPRSRAARRR